MGTIYGDALKSGGKFDFSGANITKDDLEYGKYGWDANGNLITGWRENSVTLQPSSLTLNADNPTGTITVTRAGDGVISASSSDTSVATVSVSGTTVTVNNVNETDGSATVTVNVARGTEYEAASATCAVTAAFFVNPLNTDQLTLGQSGVYFTAYPSITWQVEHLDGNYVYLALDPITEKSLFGSTNTSVYYSGSTIASKCTDYLNNTIPNVADYLEEVTVNGVTAKVFIPSKAMYQTEWNWPKANASNRFPLNGSIKEYWVSNAYSANNVWFVHFSGDFGHDTPLNQYGFRPAVKVRYK